MRAAPELLGAPTIDGGNAWPGVGEGSRRSQISLPSCPEGKKNGQFPVLNDLKNAKNTVIY